MTDASDDPNDSIHAAYGSPSSHALPNCHRETTAPLSQQPHAVDRVPMLSSDPLVTARPLRVNVAVRVGRLLSFTALVVIILFLTIGALSEGFELDRFDWVDKTPEQRQRSIDNYNSFSGGIASIFIGPLESLAMVILQTVALRTMSQRMLQPEPHWSTQLAMFVLTVGLGFLLNNGLAAMNVQIRPLDGEATILLARDLMLPSPWNASVDFETLVPESTEANAVTNTLLRSLLVPRALKPTELRCGGQPRDPLNFDMAAFGITPRDWQSRFISSARPHQTQRFEYGTSGFSRRPGALSIDIVTAAELMVHALLWMNASKALNAWLMEQASKVSLQDGQAVPVSKLLGLVSLNASSVEEQSETFLQGTGRLLQTLNSTRVSRRAVELSRVELNQFITFDAVTIETISTPSTLTFTPVDHCGPWPSAMCLVPLPSKSLSPHVLAAASCMNADGKEELSMKQARDTSSSRLEAVCPATSKTSMLVISRSQFLQADEFSADEDGRSASAVVSSLRSVTRVTVGRLSWTLQDLAPVVNASCGAPSCQGLWLSLPKAA
ncbi:hypothetical protein PINS_up010820 [Pythium insidiosum]|nr:hypothetical protein PINS_up010820 [Pythium insidiosum]